MEPVKVEPATLRSPWKTRISVQWSGTPLRESLDRLAESYSFRFFLDRRIDPSLKLVFEAKNEPLEQALPRLAAAHGLGCRILSGTAYLGPEEFAARLPGLLAVHRRRIEELPPTPRRFYRETVAIESPLLGTPKEILTALARRGNIVWKELDTLPHDLWNKTRLLGTVEELLTILLIGFEKSFEPNDDGIAVAALPQDLPTEAARNTTDRPTTRQAKPKATEKIPLARRRFTLRVEEQPLETLLHGLADRLELELKLNQKSLADKNVAPDRRVSFEVKNATAAELLHAVLRPLGLQFRIRGDAVEVY